MQFSYLHKLNAHYNICWLECSYGVWCVHVRVWAPLCFCFSFIPSVAHYLIVAELLILIYVCFVFEIQFVRSGKIVYEFDAFLCVFLMLLVVPPSLVVPRLHWHKFSPKSHVVISVCRPMIFRSMFIRTHASRQWCLRPLNNNIFYVQSISS